MDACFYKVLFDERKSCQMGRLEKIQVTILGFVAVAAPCHGVGAGAGPTPKARPNHRPGMRPTSESWSLNTTPVIIKKTEVAISALIWSC